MLQVIKSVTESESNLIANLANITAIIQEERSYHWTGFYLVEGEQLVLGPFQGPLACTRIPFGKGVCGSSWEQKKSLRVDDVHSFSGHIACSAKTNSELVVPVIKNGAVVAVLDLDSEKHAAFSEEDQKNFEEICQYIGELF
ncbi:MAG: GAF domain-containing protein [Bdellovibrionota bacterium]|nr:GAF domain-containing protein [Bdellovibrionota bacterium]